MSEETSTPSMTYADSILKCMDYAMGSNPNSILMGQGIGDFKGMPVENSAAIAITSSGFSFKAGFKNSGSKATLIITVSCNFDRNLSWMKERGKNEYVLGHEQHHFDITYIAVCLFVKKLKAANFTLSNYSALIDKINDESYAGLEKMQNDYDGQTKNGQLKDVQAEWNKKIDQQLAALLTN